MKALKDRTPLMCLAIVAVAATINAGTLIPATAAPRLEWRPSGWGGIICEFIGHLGPYCPKPIKEVVPVDPQPTPPCDPNTQSCPS